MPAIGSQYAARIGDFLASLNSQAPQLPATHAAVQATVQPFRNLVSDGANYYRDTTAQATQPPPSPADFPQQVAHNLGSDAKLGRDFFDASFAHLYGINAGYKEALRQVLGDPPPQPQTRFGF